MSGLVNSRVYFLLHVQLGDPEATPEVQPALNKVSASDTSLTPVPRLYMHFGWAGLWALQSGATLDSHLPCGSCRAAALLLCS